MRFYSWVSTYYTHSDLAQTTRDPALLDTAPLPYPALPSVLPATLDSSPLRPSRGPARSRGPRHFSTAYRLASRSSRRGACCWISIRVRIFLLWPVTYTVGQFDYYLRHVIPSTISTARYLSFFTSTAAFFPINSSSIYPLKLARTFPAIISTYMGSTGQWA